MKIFCNLNFLDWFMLIASIFGLAISTYTYVITEKEQKKK